MTSRPVPVRALLALFRVAARLLPASFRASYLAEAERDLAELLTDRWASAGRGAAVVAGALAIADLLARAPREWWAARGGRGTWTARARGPGTGERAMSAINHLRLALRALARRPGYTAAAVLTLSLGIGASVAIFAVVDAILLRPLPYPEADRIVRVSHHAPGLDMPTLDNSPGTIRFYAESGDFMKAWAAYHSQLRNLIGGPTPERIKVIAVSHEIFEVLGVQPRLGRPFGPADEEEGAAPVAILTHAAWMDRFGGDPEALGRTVELDGTPTEIVGVMPRGFAFPDPEPVALVAMHVDPDGAFGRFGTGGVGRLADGITLERATARAVELQALMPAYFNLDDGFLEGAGWSVSVRRLQDFIVGDGVASALWIVLATVGVVLLIACANVANLFLVRADSRQRELAIRTAMGAGRGSIAVGFLGESMVLAAAGGVLGCVLAVAGARLLVAWAPVPLPRLSEVAVDPTALAFGTALSALVGLVLGAVPLLRQPRGATAVGLRDGGRGATDGRERHRTRNVLVATQLALALVLLVASGLMLRSFQAMRGVDLGVDPRDVLAVGMSLGERVDDAEGARFYQAVADEVAALPGVESVGLTTLVPLDQGSANGGSFAIESRPEEETDLPTVAFYKAIGADYLATVRQPLLEGRGLERSDWEGGAPVALVNRAFADRFLGGSAVGEGLRWDDDKEFATIVGVVGDVRELGLTEEARPWAYLPMVVGRWGYPNMDRMHVVIRSRPGQVVPADAVRAIVARLDATVPLTNVRTLDEIVARDMAQTSFTMVLLGIAAGVALFLGAVGLFGVISYVVSRRTKEIGVRVALGARADDVQTMVLRQGATVSAVGVLLGLVAAFGLTRLMSSVLYGVGATDPLTFVGGPVVLVLVALVATWLPARRAARVDPVVALRAE